MHHWPDYRIILTPLSEDDGGGWKAEVPELPHCIAQGADIGQALARIRDAKDSWLDAADASGGGVPLPQPAVLEYSGKFTLRLPRSLHRQLAREAEAEGVSLNQYILYLLGAGRSSQYQGRKSDDGEAAVHQPPHPGYK